jgi:hypothetical protein
MKRWRCCGIESDAHDGRNFRSSREWRLIRPVAGRRRWLIRFRPHHNLQREVRDVNLPVACAAVSGKLAKALGRDFARCIALVGLRLRGAGSADLVLVGMRGRVALGECKYGDRRDAWKQLRRYESALRRPGCDLPELIERSYARFRFPHLCRTRGLPVDARGVDRWWSLANRNCRRQHIRKFVIDGRVSVKFHLLKSRSGVAGHLIEQKWLFKTR